MNDYPLLYGQGQFPLRELTLGQRMHPQAAAALMQMQQQAKQDGLSLEVYSSFRSFHTQLVIWNEKWHGQRPLLNDQSEPLAYNTLSDTDKLWAILRWSALPGASRHHWGTDCDLYAPNLVANDESFDLIAPAYEVGGSQYPLSQWLNQHAHHYGFYFPYLNDQGGTAPEPWHISYQPLASTLSEMHSLSQLRDVIQLADIAGKSIILPHLDEIYHRFFI